jgi:hypothetical protein
MQRLLTSAEAAEMLSLSPRTLEKWRSTGGGPKYLIIGKKVVRYRLDIIEAFAAARLFGSTSEYENQKSIQRGDNRKEPPC